MVHARRSIPSVYTVLLGLRWPIGGPELVELDYLVGVNDILSLHDDLKYYEMWLVATGGDIFVFEALVFLSSSELSSSIIIIIV